MSYLVIFGIEFQKLLSYFKLALSNLTHTVNFGIWLVFSKGPGSAFSEGPGPNPLD